MTVEVNGHFTAVRCPMPSYALSNRESTRQRRSADMQTLLAFRVPAAWLKAGENRLTIHVEGTPRAMYDWVGFGRFP